MDFLVYPTPLESNQAVEGMIIRYHISYVCICVNNLKQLQKPPEFQKTDRRKKSFRMPKF